MVSNIELVATGKNEIVDATSDWYGIMGRLIWFYMSLVQTAQILLTFAIMR